MEMEDEVKIKVLALLYNQSPAETYALVLGEDGGARRFSIVIGVPEAQSIALKINNKTPARPLTHDLINNILLTFNAKMEKTLIYDMVEDVFYAEIHIKQGEQQIVIDARTSDAIALAVRSGCPIFIKRELLNIVGVEVKPTREDQQPPTRKLPGNLDEIVSSDLEHLSNAELQELLDRAVEAEKYELAILIHNEMQKGLN